jgi:hypothetical protein
MRRALSEDRPFLVLSLILAIGFPFLRDGSLGDLFLMVWKGGAVASLAAYALRRLSGKNALFLVLYLGLSALGDALIIIDMVWGGAAFFTAHIFAIIMFGHYHDGRLVKGRSIFSYFLIFAVPIAIFALSNTDRGWLSFISGLPVGVMIFTAWTSAYPRYQVGIGVILVVIHDMLIIGSMGGADNLQLANILTWPLYYIGQLMICTGVVRTLRAD